ncbi:lactate/malate family dehydrogenase, partial [Staphylococcus epidermidis]|uniref:lactate/malate family dehydrogenase n=1 Tax=Staphylococcus epidermidis TaxID=1282 RepID=UPI0031238A17
MVSESNIEEIAIISRRYELVNSNVKDLSHMTAFMKSSVRVKVGDYTDCSDADIILIAASASMKSVNKRSELLDANAKIFNSIIKEALANNFQG